MAQDIPYEIGSETDVGSVREENQDAIGYFQTKDGAWTLLLVCDGMGGHAGGQMASNMAVETISQAFDRGIAALDPTAALTEAILAANAAILLAAQEHSEKRGMGTTVAALAVTGDQAYIAHVGDSRVYRIRPDTIERMTKDHSAVQRMVDGGLLTEEQAAEHPDSNILSMCVGAKEALEPEVRGPITVEPGDRYLLCSDGLTPLVEDAFIAAMAMMYRPPEAVGKLIAMANDRGGDDNISVQILHRSDAYPPTDVFQPDRFQLVSAPSRVPSSPSPPVPASTNKAPVPEHDTVKVRNVSMADPSKGRSGAGPHEETLEETRTRKDDSPRSRRKWVWIGLVAVIVLALLAVGGFFIRKAMQNDAKDNDDHSVGEEPRRRPPEPPGGHPNRIHAGGNAPTDAESREASQANEEEASALTPAESVTLANSSSPVDKSEGAESPDQPVDEAVTTVETEIPETDVLGEETLLEPERDLAAAENLEPTDAHTGEGGTEEAVAELTVTEEADTEEAATELTVTEEADTEEADTEEADTEEADTEEADAEEVDTENPPTTE